MEKQYSVEFFNAFLEHLQDLCSKFVAFDKFVEVSGYISMEIDNVKKERYVLSELLHASGHTLSESYCTKAFKTRFSFGKDSGERKSSSITTENIHKRRHSGNQDQNPGIKRFMSSRNVPVLDDDDDDNGNDYGDSRDETVSSAMDVQVSPTSLRTPSQQEPSVQSPSICVQRNIPSSDTVSTVSKSKHSIVSSPSVALFRLDEKSTPSTSKEISSSHQSVSEEIAVTFPQSLDAEPIDIEFKIDPESEVSDMFDQSDDALETFLQNDLNDSMTTKEKKRHIESQLSARKQMAQESPGFNPYSFKTSKWAIKKIGMFYMEKTGKLLDMMSLPPRELDQILSDFFKSLKKKDGSPYDHTTLKSMQCNIAKHLKGIGYPYAITKDPLFSQSQTTLKNLQKKTGEKTVVTNVPIEDDEVESLYECGQLGPDSLESLLNSMWFMNVKFFGVKSLPQHFYLKWGDIELVEEKKGKEYLHFKGSEKTGRQDQNLRVYACPSDLSRCFVNLYKIYASKRPPKSFEADSYFYLNVQYNLTKDKSWYTNKPLNWSQLQSKWKKMLQAANLPTNRKLLMIGSEM